MGLMAEVWSKLRGAGKGAPPVAVDVKNSPNSEIGKRPTPENSTKYLYRMMWVDPDVRQAILDIREMDRLDGRVKRIHARIARDAVKGGLVLTQTRDNPRIRAEWEAFVDRLQLRNPQKLKSDARGLAMEGNLPLQWVLDGGLNVVAGVRMPSETLLPNVGDDGRFKDAAEAYHQIDLTTGGKIATFPLWQLSLCRLDADSFDDQGALGRPFLDASRDVWRKLRMTEEDLVIRRRHRAPLRLAHVLEGAGKDELQEYQDRVEAEKGEITTDFYMNRKGGVTAVQGDAALGEIGDVVHLLDTFFSGSPFPKGLMGYTDGMARDILEDLKRDYYEEVDSFQDTLAFGYEFGFRLHLLLKGIVLDPVENQIGFGERKTETPNQLTDRLLKWMALGMPRDMIFEEMGYNAQAIRERLEEQAKRGDPYPGGVDLPGGGMPGGVKITPGNARKGESATSIGNSTALGETIHLLYDPNQPREPAGTSEGGQFASDGAGNSSNDQPIIERGRFDWEVKNADGEVVAKYPTSLSRKAVLEKYAEDLANKAAAKEAKRAAAKISKAKRENDAATLDALNTAFNENRDLIEHAHENANLKFKPMSSEDFSAKATIPIYQSRSYGNKKGSEYRLVMVDGKPAYARESDHWGKFNTNDFVNGEAVSTEHNWELPGAKTGFGNKERSAGYIFIEDLPK